MHKSIYNYLRKYDNNILSVNRLLVSTFLKLKNIEVVNNLNLKKLIIKENKKDEFQKLQEFIVLINKINKKICFEELLELFEFVISPSDKLVNGAIYTPKEIREYITHKSFSQYSREDIENFKIADISCGCGGFLINASKLLKEKTNKSYKQIFKENIFGVDIQEYSIERTKILLSLYAIEKGEDEENFDFNLYTADSLEFNLKIEHEQIKKNGGFDIILGNPPYVCSRNMDKKTKYLMSKWETCSTGHPDLYIPFFQIGFELLKPNGILGYITVNTFIKSLNGKAIRKYFNDKQINLKIIDFEDEQIFKSRTTYTSICFLTNKISDNIKYITLKQKELEQPFIYQKHFYKDLSIEKGWYLKNRNLVKELEDVGTPFGNLYNTKSGIATLKNKIYIFTPIKEEKDYFFLDENTKIEKSICKEIANSNLLVKTKTINNIIEKIIFPYQYNQEGQFEVIPEEDFKNNHPYAYQYLLSNKELLAARDKGKGKDYKFWYAFGRNQSLERTKYQLLFPQLAKEGFHSYITNNENLYFYNGMGALSNNKKELQLLQKLFLTDIFWIYVTSISKHYASNYYSLGRNYIKRFGIYNFSEKEKEYILKEKNIDKLNNFINSKYKV